MRASKILSQCLTIEQNDDNALAQHIFAASIALEHLGQYDEGKKVESSFAAECLNYMRLSCSKKIILEEHHPI